MGKITYLQVVNKSQFAQDLASRVISPDDRKSVGAILAQVTKN
jgi:hypothetical protein